MLIVESHLTPEATFFTACMEDSDIIFKRCQSRSIQALFGKQAHSQVVEGSHFVVYIANKPTIDITLLFSLCFCHHMNDSSLRRRRKRGNVI